jgi:hypothetical protein
VIEAVVVGDLKMKSGKTWREENLEKEHTIPIGSLVELGDPEYPDFRDGLRLHVIDHGRDCDGTPLYTLGIAGEPHSVGGYSEESLTIISQPTEEILLEVESGRKREKEHYKVVFGNLLKK